MREYPRMFSGYMFTLEANEDLRLDEELKYEQLDMKEGDTYVVTTNERKAIVLKKVK